MLNHFAMPFVTGSEPLRLLQPDLRYRNYYPQIVAHRNIPQTNYHQGLVMNFDAWLAPWLAWFLAAIAFATLEMFMPFFVFLFFAIGCLGVVVALFAFDSSLSQQLLIFIIVTLSSLIMLRKWMMGVFRGVTSDRTDKDFDDFPYGARVQVLRDIKPPQPGRVQHRGTAWDAVSDEDIQAGATVEIIGHAGNSRQTFQVRKV